MINETCTELVSERHGAKRNGQAILMYVSITTLHVASKRVVVETDAVCGEL